MPGNFPKQLYLLNILRGLASLAIVVWHYQHFFFVAPGRVSQEFIISDQPLFFLLFPLYNHGHYSVQLFFVLSGFVFYFIYADKIKTRSVSTYEFFIFRFSRLYPLYFITLLFVAVLQFISYSSRGAFIVYPMNDLRHFFLSLLFASSWGLELGYSFNAPTWSVSVEILLYAVFFLFALAVGKRMIICMVMMGLGAWMAVYDMRAIGWGLYGFFAGGLAFLLYERWGRGPNGWPPVLYALGLLIMSSMAIYGLEIYSLSSEVISPLQEAILFGGCFSSLVFLLAAIQNFSHGAGRSFKIIGDITYATYLLHFPVQLSVILITCYLGITLDYTNMVWLVLFMGTVILISLPTYYYFELPAQLYLRRYLIQRSCDRAP